MTRIRIAATIAITLLAAPEQLPAQLKQAKPVDPKMTLQVLTPRRTAQAAAVEKANVFGGFQFSDRIKESGIQFTNRAVEDANKHYKPVHYDHGCGIAVADVDGDGRLDIYFVTQLGGNELWRNLGNGRFENITLQAGVGLKDRVCVAASFADIDNDGDPDLFVTTVRNGNVLFENLGNGRFRDITAEARVGFSGHSSGAVFFDFDNDGLLDLFVCNVGKYTTDEKGTGGYYIGRADAFKGHLFPDRYEQSILYRNLGGRKFRAVSREMKLQHRDWSGDASIVDFNGDGYPDLYVLNMQGSDHYYENQKGKGFVEKTAQYFPKTPWGAMGVKSFDFNQDGLLDLFITDMHSDMTGMQIRAGNADFGAPFEKQKSESFCTVEWTEEYLRGSTNKIFGNAFFLNEGGGKFKEVSDAIGAETYWPWGMSAGDLNADGWDDLFVTAGMGFGSRYAINSVLLNAAGQRFVDAEFLLGVEPRAKGIDHPGFVLDCSGADKDSPYCQGRNGKVPIAETLSSRSSAIFDLDDDGDLDIVTNEMNDQPQILISNLSQKKAIHFLKVKLVGSRSNRDGLGAKVQVHAGGKTLTQFNDGKSGYLSQSSMPLYFGLAEAKSAESVEVVWPSGVKQKVTEGIAVNGLMVVKER
jgi:hypothetical protein